jgi:hypothetical protein
MGDAPVQTRSSATGTSPALLLGVAGRSRLSWVARQPRLARERTPGWSLSSRSAYCG